MGEFTWIGTPGTGQNSQSRSVTGDCGRETEVAMKIQLLMRRRFVGRAEVDDVLRTAALGKGAGVFDVGVPGRRELTVKVHAGLAGQISPRSLGRPHEGEHSCDGPVL